MIQVVGYLGSLGAAIMWIPQAVRAARHRHDLAALAGISTTAYASAAVFNALLLAYGWLSDAGPVVVAGAVNLTCATAIVTVLVGARRTAT
ncbi:hypothetical protein [Nocardioides sp. MH1]|uniref:hypothetical protein n=1 Tax=Nocardioides sp. MH1 TaxID=3242490 RepID=UPI003521DC46